MELGGVNRASAVTTSSSVVNQHTARTGESSAAPELSPQKIVQAATAPEAVDVRISDDAATTARRLDFMRQIIASRVEVDPDTRQILFQSVRQRTGEVVQQTPSDVTLKLRAYLAAAGILNSVSGKHADTEAEPGAA
jgi:uncharacterized FlaG/YvyC family protein